MELYKKEKLVTAQDCDTGLYNYVPVQAIPIPDNATNGDIIKAMFPNAEYSTDNCNFYYMRPLNEQGEWGARFGWQFDLDWWNSPYLCALERK